MDKDSKSTSANACIEKKERITVQVLLCSPVGILIMTIPHTSQTNSALIPHLESIPEKHAQKGTVRSYYLGCNTALYCQTNDGYIHF